MKKLILAFMLFAATFVACNTTPTDYYEIVGEVKGVEDGVPVELFRVSGDVGQGIAIDTITDGQFYFRVTPESAEKERLHFICLGDDFPMMGVNIWASAGDKIRVKGDNNLSYTWRVKGPAEEIASWQAYIQNSRDLYDDMQRISIEHNYLLNQRQQPDADMQQLKARYDSLNNVESQLMVDIHKRDLELIKRRKMDIVGMEKISEMAMMCHYYADSYPLRDAVVEAFNSLSEEWLQHPEADVIRASLFPPRQAEIGQPLVDGELYDLDGNKHTLGELKGEYILIDIWSRGCGPCIAALPEMEQIAEKYKGRLQVVSITSDVDSGWRKAAEHHPMTWNNWSDGKAEAGICASYFRGAIPCYTLISPDGIVLDQWEGYGEGSLLQKMAEHIK